MSDNAQLVVQLLTVLVFIYLGVRMGGIGLGLWGGAGVLFFAFVLNEAPGEPPINAMLIILAVITAASAMQAAGGMDFLVKIASGIIKANPKNITFVAPIISFFFTVGSGTSNIFFSLIPVIEETAYKNGHPAGAATRGLARRQRARDHRQPGFGGDGRDGRADGAARVRPDGHTADHHPGEPRGHRHRLVHAEQAGQGTKGRPGVPAAPGGRRDRRARGSGGKGVEAAGRALRLSLPRRCSGDHHPGTLRGPPSRL